MGEVGCFGLEYRYVATYLQNKITRAEMSAKLQIAIGQFEKADDVVSADGKKV